MAVTIQKKKQSAIGQMASMLSNQSVAEEATELQQKVDRLGQLEAQVKAFSPIQKEYDALKKSLASEIEGFQTSEEAVLHGAQYTAVYSPCANETVPCGIQEYAAEVDMETFLATVKISLTDANKYLTEAQKEKLFKKVPGARRLKAVLPK